MDFNAGVVAAGEAQIESTVMGNTPSIETNDPLVALADRSQVYLPTNNALSPVGHVHWYLEQLGQGIQHVASRVQNLAALSGTPRLRLWRLVGRTRSPRRANGGDHG